MKSKIFFQETYYFYKTYNQSFCICILFQLFFVNFYKNFTLVNHIIHLTSDVHYHLKRDHIHGHSPSKFEKNTLYTFFSNLDGDGVPIEIYRKYTYTVLWQILSSSGYSANRSAAEAVSRLTSEAERPQKIILDIGAGTGMVAEEVHAPNQYLPMQSYPYR